MSFIFHLFAGLFVFVLCCPSLEASSPCCGPSQWQAGIIGTEGEYNRDMDVASLSYVQSEIFYDYNNSQMALMRHVDNQTYHKVKDEWLIMKYSTGKMYRIENKTCTVTDIPKMMEPPCIPDDATFFGSHALPFGIMVNVWLVPDKMSGGNMRLSVTTGTCLRVSMSHMSGGPDYWLTMNMYENVTLGISDPSVFVPPSYCPQTVLKFNSDRHFFTETEDEVKNIRNLNP